MVRLLVVELVKPPDVFGFAKCVERVAKVRQVVAVDDAHDFALDAGGLRGCSDSWGAPGRHPRRLG